jgi:hypothetical protein
MTRLVTFLARLASLSIGTIVLLSLTVATATGGITLPARNAPEHPDTVVMLLLVVWAASSIITALAGEE